MTAMRRAVLILMLLRLPAAVAWPEQALPALGAVGGTAVYTTFVALGALVDGWVNEVYPREQVADLVGVLEIFCRSASTALREVVAAEAMAEEDRRYLEGIADAYDMLVAQAQSFLDWVEQGERERYDAARGRAWQRIAEVLELGEE